MARSSLIRACDFETIVNPDRTRVWLWSSTDVSNDNTITGVDIDSFMAHLSSNRCIAYFHNLKFDGQFILYWLFHNGYEHTFSRDLDSGEFSSLISDMGQFYTITIVFKNGIKVEIRDSLKLIPMKIEEMPRAFGLTGLEKLELEYTAERDINHVPTIDEIKYVKNDTLILAGALRYMLSEGMKKLTVASNALEDHRKRLGADWKYYFPGA